MLHEIFVETVVGRHCTEEIPSTNSTKISRKSATRIDFSFKIVSIPRAHAENRSDSRGPESGQGHHLFQDLFSTHGVKLFVVRGSKLKPREYIKLGMKSRRGHSWPGHSRQELQDRIENGGRPRLTARKAPLSTLHGAPCPIGHVDAPQGLDYATAIAPKVRPADCKA